VGVARVIYLHSEDLDGWLAPPNRPLRPLYAAALLELQGLAVEADGTRHEIQVVLNSGKPPEYLEAQARAFGGEFVISGNGAAWRRCGGPTRRFGPPCPDLARLRRLLDLPGEAGDVVRLSLRGEWVEVALEEKRDAHGDIVLSFFPEQAPVAHRWTFRQGTDRAVLGAYLQELVEEHGLAVHVAPPHADGALDVLPLLDGRPVGKWTLPRLAAELFPGADLRLTHAGDALNDLSAMEEDGVIPLTSTDCPLTAAVAQRKGGVVAARTPAEGAALECYAELARRGWYGPLSSRVLEVTGRHLGITRPG
jgi:hypothetical protein